jgi:carbon monoxide dehydrogenase subunit G
MLLAATVASASPPSGPATAGSSPVEEALSLSMVELLGDETAGDPMTLSGEGAYPEVAYLDTYGHGTHMAGIMVGRRTGHEGIALHPSNSPTPATRPWPSSSIATPTAWAPAVRLAAAWRGVIHHRVATEPCAGAKGLRVRAARLVCVAGDRSRKDGQMRELTASLEVAAKPESVWAIITDLDAFERTISAVESVERLDGGDGFGVGTRWRETRKMFGRAATEEMEVTSLDDGRSYVTEADSHGAHYRTVMTVEPSGSDGSRLSMTLGAEPHGMVTRVVAATVGRLFERATRKALEKDLAEIAAAARTSS